MSFPGRDELDVSLSTIQTYLDGAITLTQSHPTLDSACKTAIIDFLNQAKTEVTNAQNHKSQCDQDYIQQVLKDSRTLP